MGVGRRGGKGRERRRALKGTERRPYRISCEVGEEALQLVAGGELVIAHVLLSLENRHRKRLREDFLDLLETVHLGSP